MIIEVPLTLAKAKVNGASQSEADVYVERGLDYVEKGETHLAIEQFRKAIEINPKHAEAQCFLGIEVYKTAVPNQDVDKLKEAIVELEKALKINPSLGIAHDVISFAYYIVGDLDKAKKHHAQAKVLGIENPVVERKLNKAFYMKQQSSKLTDSSNEEIEAEEYIESHGSFSYQSKIVEDHGFVWTFNELIENGDGTSTFYFELQNNNDSNLKVVFFELPKGADIISPTETFSEKKNYNVSIVYNDFKAIKFQTDGAGIKDGSIDTFIFTIKTNDASLFSSMRVKASTSKITGEREFKQ